MGVVSLVRITEPRGSPNLESMSGPVHTYRGTYTFSPSYTSGGEVLDLAALFPVYIGDVHAVVFTGRGGYVFEWEAGRIKARRNAGAAGVMPEVPTGTNLSAIGPVEFVAFVQGKPREVDGAR